MADNVHGIRFSDIEMLRDNREVFEKFEDSNGIYTIRSPVLYNNNGKGYMLDLDALVGIYLLDFDGKSYAERSQNLKGQNFGIVGGKYSLMNWSSDGSGPLNIDEIKSLVRAIISGKKFGLSITSNFEGISRSFEQSALNGDNIILDTIYNRKFVTDLEGELGATVNPLMKHYREISKRRQKNFLIKR